MQSAILGHTEIVNILQARVGELNARDNGQHTAVLLGKIQRKGDVFDILEKAGTFLERLYSSRNTKHIQPEKSS